MTVGTACGRSARAWDDGDTITSPECDELIHQNLALDPMTLNRTVQPTISRQASRTASASATFDWRPADDVTAETDADWLSRERSLCAERGVLPDDDAHDGDVSTNQRSPAGGSGGASANQRAHSADVAAAHAHTVTSTNRRSPTTTSTVAASQPISGRGDGRRGRACAQRATLRRRRSLAQTSAREH